jgi:hypothetical protein
MGEHGSPQENSGARGSKHTLYAMSAKVSIPETTKKSAVFSLELMVVR